MWWENYKYRSIENEILSINKEIKELKKQERQVFYLHLILELSSFISARNNALNKKLDENEEIKDKKREEF